MNCPFCGLETGSPTPHETQEACIEALRSQVSQLRNVLQHTRHAAEPVEELHTHAVADPVMLGGERGDRSG